MKREIQFLKGFIFDPYRKPLYQIFKDIRIVYKSKNKLNISNYFQSLMYKKEAGDLKDYFDGETMNQIILNDNKRGKHPILENKILFSQYMKENNVPTAKYLGKIEDGFFIINNLSSFELKDEEKLIKTFKDLLHINKSIFIKPIDTLGGKGIIKLNSVNNLPSIKINSNLNYIIEEGIIQHDF